MKKEIVKIVLLDPKLQIIKYLTISKGSLNDSIVQAKEVMIPITRKPTTSFALIHNYPSSDPTPSQKYFETIHRLNQTGKLIGVHILDPIIIGVNRFISTADEGLL